jgi:hypothetical protein
MCTLLVFVTFHSVSLSLYINYVHVHLHLHPKVCECFMRRDPVCVFYSRNSSRDNSSRGQQKKVGQLLGERLEDFESSR